MTAAIISRRAGAELADAVAWIARDNPRAAQAFKAAVLRAAELIGAHSAMGSVRVELAPAPYRFLPFRGFSYIIIYRPDPAGARIVRIVHGARDLRNVLRDLE